MFHSTVTLWCYVQIEYNIPTCASVNDSVCIHTQQSSMEVPIGGDVIYAVAHQHAGGIGAAIYGQVS